MTHAKYSPSSLELLELCPCFCQDESRDMSAADDGTRLHKGVETQDLGVCQDEEEEDVVQRCIDYEKDLVSRMTSDHLVFHEVLLQVRDLTEGTADVVIVDGFKAYLLDWKFGRQPVADAEDNVQMQGYVLGIFNEYPDVEEVEVHIICPRQDVGSVALYKKSDCNRIYERIVGIIEACERDDKTPSANEKSCRFCGAKAACPAIGETALVVAKNIGLPLPIEFEPGRMIRPEDRAKAQVLSYILEDWAKKVREYNTKAWIEDGVEIPGFELRSKRGTTTVVDVFTAVQTLLKQYDIIHLEDILQACRLSIPQLVDQIYAHAQMGEKKVTKKGVREEVNAVLKEVVSESDTITFLQRKKGKSNEDIIEECT